METSLALESNGPGLTSWPHTSYWVSHVLLNFPEPYFPHFLKGGWHSCSLNSVGLWDKIPYAVGALTRRGSAGSNQKNTFISSPKVPSNMLYCCCQDVHNLMTCQFSSWWHSGRFGNYNNLFCQGLNMDSNVNQNISLPAPRASSRKDPTVWWQDSAFCFTVPRTRRKGRTLLKQG